MMEAFVGIGIAFVAVPCTVLLAWFLTRLMS